MLQIKNPVHSHKLRSLLILWGAIAVSVLIIFFPFLFGDRLVICETAISPSGT